MTDFPLLTTLIVLPALAAVGVALIPSRRIGVVRWAALGSSLVVFAASIPVFTMFEPSNPAFQLTESYAWIPDWGVRFTVGVDGITLFLVLMSTLIVPVSIAATWGHVSEREKGFYVAVLGLEAAMLGVFLALDLILFYVFFESMLVPMYFLIGIWGGKNRRYAAIKFFLYTMLGGLLMLTGILYMYFASGAQTFDYTALRELSLSPTEQLWLFGAFFAAFAIKVPVFPFHTWLPDAHTEAPTIGSVDLAAILLKIGGYGIIRFALPFFPYASQRLAPWIAGLAVTAVLYGALVAMAQGDIKRLVAYSSVAHMGFVVLGVAALDTIATSASVVQMVNHGLATGCLFLLIGFVYERTHSRAIDEYSGLAKATPVFGGVFLLVVMSSIALPGLNGFVGEFPILLGAYRSFPWAGVLATFGVILAALYLLWPYQRMFHGPVGGHAEGLRDMRPHEVAVLAPLLVLLVGIGLYPDPLYARVTPTIDAIIAEVEVEATQVAEQLEADRAAPDVATSGGQR